MLFRNTQGQAFALEDRCPYRRVATCSNRRTTL
ncbi:MULTISPECIES: hypothetical protein [Pseudomonas]